MATTRAGLPPVEVLEFRARLPPGTVLLAISLLLSSFAFVRTEAILLDLRLEQVTAAWAVAAVLLLGMTLLLRWRVRSRPLLRIGPDFLEHGSWRGRVNEVERVPLSGATATVLYRDPLALLVGVREPGGRVTEIWLNELVGSRDAERALRAILERATPVQVPGAAGSTTGSEGSTAPRPWGAGPSRVGWELLFLFAYCGACGVSGLAILSSSAPGEELSQMLHFRNSLVAMLGACAAFYGWWRARCVIDATAAAHERARASTRCSVAPIEALGER